ncbi:hypothetical protein CNR22_07265 [Sphingobacteriaceae bacterium]|nr:hypothetical protein CNR22_07265 [Sphingobacteriaceae bacterium]
MTNYKGTAKTSPQRWLPNYIKTYVERDVRFIRNIENIFLFHNILTDAASLKNLKWFQKVLR